MSAATVDGADLAQIPDQRTVDDALSDLQVPADDRLSDTPEEGAEGPTEEQYEAERQERYETRKAALADLDDESLSAIVVDPDTYIDGQIAKDLLEERTSVTSGDDKAEELRSEAGEPVGPMPPNDPEEMRIPPDQIVVAGTAAGSKHKWDGKQPGTTILSLKGFKVEVDGAFKKGERIKFGGEAVVKRESCDDKLDPTTKQVVEAKVEYTAVVLDFELDE